MVFARWLAVLLLVAGAFAARPAGAHEPTISVLDLTEVRPGFFTVRWSLPPSESNNDIHPLFPPNCLWDPPALDCGATGLNGEVRFDTEKQRQSAMMLHIRPLAGPVQTTLLSATQTRARLRTTPRHGIAEFGELALEHLGLGVRHILQGPDHLLFVLGLVWIVSRTNPDARRRRLSLLKTVTAFTVAHSLTLAAASFGVVRPPVAAVNATVALSILFLGPEMLRAARGETSLSLRRPHVVAFCFGLLHGFGFASALRDAGLGARDLPYALLGFNAGVEIGQLGFILFLVLLARATTQLRFSLPAMARFWPAYVVGTLGAFWTIGRTAVLLGV